MKFLLKLITIIFLIFAVVLGLSYATLQPKPYQMEIIEPEVLYNKTLDGSFKLITYNLGLLDIRTLGSSRFKPTEFIRQRAQLLPQYLLARDADVIALQEIYEKHHINYFIKNLQETYPYYFFQHKSKIKLNNGLMVFSKYPFTAVSAESQKEKGPIDEMIIADRGLLSTVISLDENTLLNLVNLHATSGGTLNAQDSDKLNKMRQRQLQQAHTLANYKNTEFQIITGDINAGPNISAINYQFLLDKGYSDVYKDYSETNGSELLPTWSGDNALNSMRGYTDKDQQRIDHIYLSEQLTNNSRILKVERIFADDVITVNGKSYPLSDHYGLEVELQIN